MTCGGDSYWGKRNLEKKEIKITTSIRLRSKFDKANRRRGECVPQVVS